MFLDSFLAFRLFGSGLAFPTAFTASAESGLTPPVQD